MGNKSGKHWRQTQVNHESEIRWRNTDDERAREQHRHRQEITLLQTQTVTHVRSVWTVGMKYDEINLMQQTGLFRTKPFTSFKCLFSLAQVFFHSLLRSGSHSHSQCVAGSTCQLCELH